MQRLCLLATGAVVLTACGSPPPVPPAPSHSVAEREWIDNAFRFIDLLESDVTLTAAGGSSIEAARKALSNVNDVYTTLVAYTYFDGCGPELASVGQPSARAERVVRTLVSVCARLEHASALYHRAVTGNKPALLLRATRVSQGVQPLLARASSELAAIPR